MVLSGTFPMTLSDLHSISYWQHALYLHYSRAIFRFIALQIQCTDMGEIWCAGVNLTMPHFTIGATWDPKTQEFYEILEYERTTGTCFTTFSGFMGSSMFG